ncbi:MAG: MATE family efflux transporter [Lachnospiraceae bacterium]|nr:MATE family efflux transporter [Lachnospiraceae bacterium]
MAEIREKKKNEIDMTHGSLADKLVKFALPLIATGILQQLFNAADIAVVGRFASPNHMAAVGSNSAVINLILGLFMGLSVGANVVIANLIGAKNRQKINEAIHTVIAVSFIAGMIAMTIGFFAAKPILVMMGAPEEVMNYAILYLRIYCLAMPFILLYNFSSSVLRSKGDSRRPLIALFLSGVINIGLNMLLVIVFHLHVIGVAAATAASNIFASALVLHFLMTEEETFRFSFKKLHINKAYMAGMIRIGIPAGIQGMIFSLSNVVIQTSINSFGANAIAGSTAAQNLEFFSYCIINGFGQSAVTFTSQNYGAGNADRCRKVFRYSMLIGVGVDLIYIALAVLFRAQILRLFTVDEAVLKYAELRVMCVCVFHFLIASYEISAGALRGMNYSLIPALISVFGTCVLRLTWVFTVVRAHHTFETLMYVYPVSWIFTGIVMLTAYYIVSKRTFPKLVMHD